MKKALSLLLALAAIMCFGVFAVSAEETTTTPVHTDHCYCVNTESVPSGHTCEEGVTWEDLSTATIADGGHYYLGSNLAKSLTVVDGMEITVCLNGFNLYAGCPITVNKGGVVNICNCKTAGRIYSTKRTQSAVVLVNAAEEENFGTVNLYSGNISGAANDNTHIRCVDVTGGQFNMYGGQIINGRSDGSVTNDAYKHCGGNVYVHNSTARVGEFNMYGGTITGGQATNQGGNVYIRGGQFTMNGGTVTGGKLTGTPSDDDTVLVNYGGNFFVTSTAKTKKGTLELNGGTVTGGTAYYGGNVATDGNNGGAVDLTIAGGTVSNGIASADGGNLYLHNTTNGTVFKMNSGSITGGQATGNGGNICVPGNYSPTFTGGTVSGGTATNGGNIYLNNTSNHTFAGTAISGGTATENGGNIHIDNSSTGTITVSASTISGGSAKNGGNIYCKKQLKVSGGEISNGSATNSGGNINLNGTAAKLSMTDGTVSGGHADNTGGNIYSLNSTDVSITGGSVTGGTATSHGGNMYITHAEMVETRKLTISDVTVSGGESGGQGGNIYAAKVGVLTFTNVTLTGGKATTSGANAYLSANGTGSISGCTFTLENAEKCTSSGGNVTFAGTVYTVTNTTISGGDAANGGAVALGQTSEVTFDKCTIETVGGSTGKCFYIYQNGELTLKDCDVKNLSSGGTAIWNKGTVTLQGTVNIPDGNMDMMLDCRDQEDACFDITDLTAQDEPYGIRRWQVDNVDDDPGVLAIGATAETSQFFFAWADGYDTEYNADEGKIYLVAMAVHGRNADGIVRGYESLDAALADTQEELGIVWYQLNADLDGQNITKSIMIDLAGHKLTNVVVAEGVTVSGMDTTTDDYDCTDGYGTLSGTINGTIASNIKNDTTLKRYLTVNESGVYSFHRIYLGITHMNLKPGVTGVGYKAYFYGDSKAVGQVADYGYNLWLEGVDNVVTASKGSAFTSGQALTLRLENFDVENYGTTAVNANVFVKLKDGNTITSGGYSYTLKGLLESIAKNVGDFTNEQMAALQTMCQNNSDAMANWEIDAIRNWTATEAA